jgi:ubiquinone/menaquinone biosynthesis C-methylase UbiE
MIKVENELDVLSQIGPFKDKVVIDVGCGTGDLVRELTKQGARVIGVDTPEMLNKAKELVRAGDETYMGGGGESLPMESNIADVLVFFASLHHVPPGMMAVALEEAHRVLKPKGIVLCLEPVGQKGSYFEILSLLEDERDLQSEAFKAIKNANTLGLVIQQEYMIYIERSYDDYVKLMEVFVEDRSKKNECLARAKEITEKLSIGAGIKFQDFRYKSICRINILKKI